MRDRSLTALVKSIVSNLTIIKIIFFILIILIVTNVVLSVLVVPLLPLLLFPEVGVKGIHHLNHLFPLTRVKSTRILMSDWIGWAKTGSDWAHSLDIALILSIRWVGTTKIEV